MCCALPAQIKKGDRFIYSPHPNDMPYDLDELKKGEVIHAKSWAGGIT